MKPKSILLMSLMIVLNLYAFEPMMPGKASEKAIEQLEQVDNNFFTGDDYFSNDYSTNTSPSFKCSDAKGKYKFKEYSLEDFCLSVQISCF